MNISAGLELPWHFRLFVILIALAAVMAIKFNVIMFIVIEAACLALIFLKSGIYFNIKAGTYQPYYLVYGLRIGKTLVLKSLEKVYLNRNVESQKMYSAHTATGYTAQNEIFDGYLKFVDGEKVYLTSSNKRSVIINELKKLSGYLNTSFSDNT